MTVWVTVICSHCRRIKLREVWSSPVSYQIIIRWGVGDVFVKNFPGFLHLVNLNLFKSTLWVLDFPRQGALCLQSPSPCKTAAACALAAFLCPWGPQPSAIGLNPGCSSGFPLRCPRDGAACRLGWITGLPRPPEVSSGPRFRGVAAYPRGTCSTRLKVRACESLG